MTSKLSIPSWNPTKKKHERKKKQRTKSFEKDGVGVCISFECGEVVYSVEHDNKTASNRDFHQAVANTGVPQKKVNHLVRALKKVLGL